MVTFSARPKMADVIQQVRNELDETVNGRIDMSNGIATALQRVSANPSASKPYRISDVIPRKLGGQQRQGRSPTLHARPALVDSKRGLMKVRLLVSVESTDKFDSSTPCGGSFTKEVHNS